MAKAKASMIEDLIPQAERLAADPALYRAFSAAETDPKLRDLALQAPEKLLARYDVKLPEGLSVLFFEGHPEARPYPFGPEIFPNILLTRCRTVWVRQCKSRPSVGNKLVLCEWKQETFCFGFEIIPGKWLPPF